MEMATYIVSELPNGNTIKLPYQEWISGNRNPLIINDIYGNTLFTILKDELGQIIFKDNVFVWNFDLTYNQNTIFNLLGKIAEAVIVERCHKDNRINECFIKVARRGTRMPSESFSSKYTAIGTGLLSTQKQYPQYWYPQDTQRDVIWVEKQSNMLLQQLKCTPTTGCSAGIQVKVSSNGMGYVYQPLIKHVYYYPLVYFGVNGDFTQIAQTLIQNGYLHRNMVGVDFVDARAIDPTAFDIICNYQHLLLYIFQGKMKPADLITEALNDPTLATAISATVLSEIGISCEY